MPTLNITLPELDAYDLNSKKELRALRDSMYQLQEQLAYTLAHLDDENFSDSVKERISASVQSSEAARQSVEECRAVIEKTNESIALKVQKGQVISEINQSAEQVKIKAQKISLEGVVTANEGFRINEDGSMEATAGSLGAFSADAQGNLAGAASLQVGGVTLSGNYASGLMIRPENLEYATSVPANSSGMYFLGITDTGVMVLADLYIENGALRVTPPGSAPDQGGSANVILITNAGNGLQKRQYANVASSSLGSCATGERYAVADTLTDEDGFFWTKCNAKYSFNSSTGKYVSVSVAAFWVRKTNNARTVNYYDSTTVNT